MTASQRTGSGRQEGPGAAGSESDAVAGGDRAQRLLAAAGEVLASSLDFETTLSNVARLAVPALADWCIVDVVESDGQLRRVATAHADPAKEALLHELRRRYPPDRDSPQPAARVVRSGRPELLPDLTDEVLTQHTRDAAHAGLIRGLGLRSHLAVPLIARGRVIGAVGFGSSESGRRYGPADVALAEELARRCALAVDNARLYRDAQDQASSHAVLNTALREAAEARDRALEEVEAARTRLAFLAEASAQLAGSLDYETTLATVARLAVPRLADWCAVDVQDPDGTIRRLAVAHVDPAKVELAHEIGRRYPPDPNAAVGAPAVLRTGEAQHFPAISDEILAAAARDPEHLAMLRQLAPSAALVLPMAARGRTLGALTLAWAESGRRYSEADVLTAEELARRCAVALDNARLHVAERRARASAEASQRHLRELFMQAPAAIAVLRGPEHVFEFANPRYFELVGGREVLGKPARAALPELEGQGLFEVLDRVFATGEPFAGTEVLVRWDRDGDGELEEGHFNFVYQPYRGVGPAAEAAADRGADAARGASRSGTSGAPAGETEGAVEGILVHAVEVTEQVQARERLEELAAERDAFLAAASHDLKNPLTAIKGTAQILRRQLERAGTVTPDRLVVGLETIESTGDQMLAHIVELLDVAHLRLGQPLSLDRRPTDLVALARRAAAAQQAATDRHVVRVEAAGDELVGTWDPVRLARVVENLLANAVKFSPSGGEVVVAVRPEPVAAGGAAAGDGGAGEAAAAGLWAVLSVRDSGMGILPADRERIFERFGRGSNVAGIAGTGIGLAGVVQIVGQHGGTIGVDSEEGAGSTFTVRLPITSGGSAP